MEKQLFENLARSALGGGNGKIGRSLMALSSLLHLGVAIICISFIATDGPANTPKSIVVYSGSISFDYPKPPPPPLPPKRKFESKNPDKPIEKTPERVLPTAPVEVPNEIKPEPPKEPEKDSSDDAGGVDGGVVGGVAGGVPGGVPDGVPGGVVGQPSQDSSQPPQGPTEVKGSDSSPKRTKYVHPTYPIGALRARIEGMVIIEAIIGKNGRIKSARITKSIPLLDRAALEAIKKWEYTPMIVDGEAREVFLTVIMSFKLT